ncbi:AMP-binding protein [Kitasatospora sp. MAP5-34]|uniref:AMP-binding protein n=1 Tax=Kitasatospora sp. MAP5-34 TaxID=3035102 RepID=UPI0024770FF2|nr:AMP-binding protein [Kitasatospora sp. MAP5-34]MDH6579064.1 long-subunit acyl-CoA synthetase (AMP-forming)/alpha-ketoglutarate-dependent taurine dioxygenase [Kitasatospora sp. MAP5-34]
MRDVENALGRYADTDRPLVQVLDLNGEQADGFSYRQITRAARQLADQLADRQTTGARLRVGVVCGNTPEFVVADLALLAGRAVEVPVPLAFTREQASGMLELIDVLLTDGPGRRRLAEWGEAQVLPAGCPVVDVELSELLATASRPYSVDPVDADWVCKVIHTSGTTSRPKGVRIRANGIGALIASLSAVMPAEAFGRYLSTVPFSLLIEQVTGLYMVLLDGGCVTLLPQQAALVGTSADASDGILRYLRAARPTALVATPALAGALATAAKSARAAGREVAPALFGTDEVPLVCCGGAPVHPDVLRELDELGLPVYEGYGLSENSSVVSWNTPAARRFGTVGRPLPHVRVALGEDGELLVNSTSLFDGYTRDDPTSCPVLDGWLYTGDLAEIDADGFVTITGRKKNVIITSVGRNVAPEWVEAQYARLPFVQAVAVVGNQLPVLHGLFVIRPDTDPEQARAALAAFGREHLSEVEQVGRLRLATADEPSYHRFFTVTGRPMRAAIERAIHDGDLETITTATATAVSGNEEEKRMSTVQPYGSGSGRLVLAAPGQDSLGELAPEYVTRLLAEAGFLVLRGFRPDLEAFSLFVKNHSDRVTLDPARSFHGGDVAQKVDAGTDAVGLHLENGNSPFRPDLTWFLCEKAAASGSQTTVCDGYRVWDAVGEEARTAFAAQDIQYSRRVEEPKWRAFAFHRLGGVKPLDEITLDDFTGLVEDPESTVVEPLPDGSVTYAYRTPAAHRTLFGDRLSWANSIFGPSYNYEKPVITFADGSELPAALLAELERVTAQVTEDVEWQDGDVVLIDNTRVMHGRRAIEDPDRTIYNAQSYLRRDLLPGS